MAQKINATGRDCPSKSDLNNHVVSEAARKWKDLGTELLENKLVRTNILENIEENFQHSVEKCCQAMFSKWLDTKSANWDKLLEALRSQSVQLLTLANRIEQMLVAKGDESTVVMETGNGQQQFGTMLTSYEDLEVEFAITTQKIKQELCSSPVPVTSVVEQLQTISAVRNKHIPLLDEHVFDRVTTIQELWNSLNRYWSIFNYDILNILLKLVGCEKAKQMLDEFLSRIDISALEDFDLVLHYEVLEPQGFLKPLLRVKVKSEKCTYSIQRKVEEELSEKFNLREYALRFRGIKDGCIELMYEVSNALMSYLVQCEVNRFDLVDLAAHNIVWIRINNMELRVPTEITNMDGVFFWSEVKEGAEVELLHDTDQRVKVVPESSGQGYEIDFSKLSIDNAFSTLVSTMYRILTSYKIKFEQLRKACFENVNALFGAHLPEDLVIQIKASSNLRKLFEVLTLSSYWSWIDIRMLIKMATISGVAMAIELLVGYQKALFSKKLSLLVKHIPKLNISAGYSCTEVKENWKEDLDKATVQDLVYHWSELGEMLDVKEPTLLLKEVLVGYSCIELHWLIPTQLIHHVCSAVFNARHANMSIQHLSVEDCVIISNDESSVTQESSFASSYEVGKDLSEAVVQLLSSSESIKPSMIKAVFNCLANYVTQLLKCCNTKELLLQCTSLEASNICKVALFSNTQMKELGKHVDSFSLLQDLKFLWTWSDHSILDALASPCDDAVKLLKEYDDHLDTSALVASCPISCVSPDMVPEMDSSYTVLAIMSELHIYQTSLQFVLDVRSLLIKTCDITSHSIQLLAARAGPTVTYWTIPKSVVSLIVTKVLEHHRIFHDGLISEVSIYPNIRIATKSGRLLLGSLVYLSSNVPAGDDTEVLEPKAIERTKSVLNWLSKPEDLFTAFDKLFSEIENKDNTISQLESDYLQKSKMFEHVGQQNRQLRADISECKKEVMEYRQFHEKWLTDGVVLEKQWLQERLELLSAVEIEDAVKKLQSTWNDFRVSLQEIPLFTSTEFDDKDLLEKQDENNLTCHKLNCISHEICEAKERVVKLKEKKFNLQEGHSMEAETREVGLLKSKVSQLEEQLRENEVKCNETEKELNKKEAEISPIRLEFDQLTEELRLNGIRFQQVEKEKKQLIKKVTDLKITLDKRDAEKPEKVSFGFGRYGEACKMSCDGTWCTAKVLHKELLGSGQSVEKVTAVVKKQCSSLQHSNLVTFVGITKVGYQPAILTELMEINLCTYMKLNSGSLSVDTQFSLCKDMSCGLEELHKSSLLHKNLHGRNVLIKDNQAKISDYYYPLLQLEGSTPDFVDTKSYMAPEVIEDRSKFSEGSDVFSLGVLLLQVIAMKPVILDYRQSLGEISIDHILLQLIQRCLSDEPVKRPSAVNTSEAIKSLLISPQFFAFKALTKKVMVANSSTPFLFGNMGDEGAKVEKAIEIIDKKIGKNWKRLARCLGFEPTDIDAITYENPHYLKECIHSFINQWKEEEGKSASVVKLVNGLVKAELVNIADDISQQCLGRSLSTRLLKQASVPVVANSSAPLPMEVERDKTGVTIGDTSASNDIVTAITSPTTPTTTTTTTVSSSSSPRSPQQTFEVGDMICIKGAEGKGGGVVKWIGFLPGLTDQVAGLEMDNKLEGGHDGLWKGQRYFTCPLGHGIIMPFSKILKNPLFLPDSEPIALNNLSGINITPNLHRSVSDGIGSKTTKKPSSDKPLSEKLLYKFLELTADPRTDSSDTVNVPVDGDDVAVLKVTFPGDRVGLIIGTDGANIQEVQNTTHTTIRINHNRSDPNANGTALITGSKQNCEDALVLMCKKLNEKICRFHAIEETIDVPDSSVGRIIGSEGAVKRAIEKLSGAKVKIDQDAKKDLVLRLLASDAKVVIRGSREQIDRAKQLIEMAQHGENVVLLQNVLTEVFKVMKAMGFELS